MIIEFEKSDGDNILRDALILPDDHTFTDEEIEAMKQARFDNWLIVISTPPEETPPQVE